MMTRVVSAVLLLLAPLAARADDWPTYRHDVRRSGATAEKIDASRLKEIWTYRAPVAPRTAWGSPARWDAYKNIRDLRAMRTYDQAFHVAAVGDALFFSSSVDDTVRAVDARTGETRWTFFADAPVRIAPTVSDGRVYFAADDGKAYCVSADRGILVWSTEPPKQAPLILHNGRFITLWPCRTGVLVDDGIAYFGNSMLPWEPSWISAVDAATGEVRYTQKLSAVTLEGALVASSSRLIAPQGRIGPLVLQKRDGRPHGTPKEGGGGSFVSLTPEDHLLHGPGNLTGWVTVTNLDTLKPVRQMKGQIAAVRVGEATVFLADRHVSARIGEKVVWRSACPLAFDLIVAGDHVFVGALDRVLAFTLKDGARVWEAPVDGRAYGLSVANGGLFVSTDEGAIHTFRVDGAAAPAAEPPAPANPEPEPLTIAPVREAGLVDRWVFHRGMAAKARRRGLDDAARRVDNLAGRESGKILGDVQIREAGGVEALWFDGRTHSVRITDDHRTATLPAKAITAEAWVRLDKTEKWGGIVGAIQDDGDQEFGWLLGYLNDTFSFAVAGRDANGKLTYLAARTPFKTGTWYHVMGTYDGTVQKLYVNGKLENSAKDQRGPIRYPAKTFYEIGAYHDTNEYYRLKGLIHEVRVYDRALPAASARAHHALLKREFPEPIDLALGPVARFTGRRTAEVHWRTSSPSPSLLEIDTGNGFRRISDDVSKTSHTLTVDGLKGRRIAPYRILTRQHGTLSATPTFDLDSHFNYSIPRPPPANADSDAEAILEASRIRQGIALLLGDGTKAIGLARSSNLRIVVVDTDRGRVDARRRSLVKEGLYGTRISVHLVDSLDTLPFTGRFANLIVAHKGASTPQEIARVLRPDGGVSLIGGIKTVRGPLQGAGQWSHQYGLADNSAFGGESLNGARGTSDLRVQWIGHPGPRAQPDRNPRKPSPLSTNGRLFVQGLKRLIAADAHNGSILWALEIPPLGRFNIPRDSGNWCADRDHVFVAVKDRCWQLDAQTGALVRVHEPGGKDADWSYVGRVGNRLLGSRVPRGTAFTNFWGKADAGWYDARSGPVTFKVCSDALFGIDVSTGKRAWTRTEGVIINSTITADANGVYFVESRNAKVKASASRRVGMAELWKDQFMVALDPESGRVLWEKELDTKDGTVVFYMALGEGKLVVVASSDKVNEISTFDARTGKPGWKRDMKWPGGKGDHGKAMSRPAIAGGRVFVKPQAFDLATGEPHKHTMPMGHGCGTYAATTHTLIYRSKQVTVWDAVSGRESGWPRLRPGCWLSTIPANGMLLSPEAGGGCSCGSWMETSIGFTPDK